MTTAAAALCQKCGVNPARRRARCCDRCSPPKPFRRPVWSDREGESFPDMTAAAAAVGVPRATFQSRMRRGVSCGGRVWQDRPPAWVAERAAEAERRRQAAYRVSPWWAAVGPGPASKNCEQRFAETKDRRRL